MLPAKSQAPTLTLSQNEWLGVKSFVKRTHTMIDALSNEGGRIAQWSNDGSVFVVRDKINLTRRFQRFGFKKMQLYRSFEKQLNDHGFKKLPVEAVRNHFDGTLCSESRSDPVFFTHPHFRRNCPRSMELISDRRRKSSARKKLQKLRSVSPSPKKDSPLPTKDDEEKEELQAQIRHMGEKLQRMEELLSELQREKDDKPAFVETVSTGKLGRFPHSSSSLNKMHSDKWPPQEERVEVIRLFRTASNASNAATPLRLSSDSSLSPNKMSTNSRPTQDERIELMRLFRTTSNASNATCLSSVAKPASMLQAATSISSFSIDPISGVPPFLPDL